MMVTVIAKRAGTYTNVATVSATNDTNPDNNKDEDTIEALVRTAVACQA